MSDAEPISKTRFQQLVNPAKPGSEDDTDEANGHESEYMWHGQRFRVVPQRQAPLLQFRLTISSQETLQVKYAYVTHHSFLHQNENNHNEISMIIRDSMRITLAGLNLWQLDDALLMQRVVEIQGVSELQAAAALKRGEASSIIFDIRLEYGRFDIENRIWMRGNGYWSEVEKRWVSEVAPPIQRDT